MPNFIENLEETESIQFINSYVNNSITCDMPNADLNSFKGSLAAVGYSIPLGIGRFILICFYKQLFYLGVIIIIR